MTDKLTVELAMRRVKELRDRISRNTAGVFATDFPETAKRMRGEVADLDLLLETLHKRGFAYER